MSLYGRIAARPGGERDLACARLRRRVEVVLDRAGLQVRRPGRLRVDQLAEMLHAAGYELEMTAVPAGEPRRRATEKASPQPPTEIHVNPSPPSREDAERALQGMRERRQLRSRW